MLLLFSDVLTGTPSLSALFWIFLAVPLPASIGVLAALIFLSRKHRLTEATIVGAMGFGVLCAVVFYYVLYLVALYADPNAQTTLIEKLAMPLGILGPVTIIGLCWGSFTAAASYVPFRFIAFKRIR
ncbi:hypothetical protein [Henriciella marina]|jgi:predicted permease|uniref:Uncharacterized protein n=1 Tax=Henriciella marina TaxID=453851 RepID=A0ABT4LY31_9PROT|nr:hypothetical protein [Henriciella marina]MCZ4299289.1 hypothetical protein [Henriciella marina]